MSPHGGKIMIALVFMGHDITSVGGSIELWLLEGMGDCNTLGGVSCWRNFFCSFFLFFYHHSARFITIHRFPQALG